MITVNGVDMRTEAQWAEKYRAVLKRQRDKGVRREWYITKRKTASAVFYREDQTRPFNQKELRRARNRRRELLRTRKARLSCSCCGEYFGREARYELQDGLCGYCRRPHTSWQWLSKKHLAVRKGAVPVGRHPKYPDPETGCWEESKKEWFYYNSAQVSPVSDERFERLKAQYIKLYGGWEMIDLENTTYDGHKWW